MGALQEIRLPDIGDFDEVDVAEVLVAPGDHVAVDESLVGGVVARVGDVVFDGSIRTHLQQLRSNLMKGH